MTTEQEHSFQGWVTEIDNARNYRPLRVGMKDSNNQTQWFGTFDIKISQMLEQAGVNSGPWNIQYIMKPWTGQDGIERYNYNIKSLSGEQAPQVTPPPAPTPQPQSIPQPTPQPTEPNKYQVPWSTPPLNLVDKLDTVGRSIVRQVAFKDIQNKDDKTADQLWYLTNLYESIILGNYNPESLDEAYEAIVTPPGVMEEDSFIQQTF